LLEGFLANGKYHRRSRLDFSNIVMYI